MNSVQPSAKPQPPRNSAPPSAITRRKTTGFVARATNGGDRGSDIPISGGVQAVEIIDVSEHKPRRIPSAKWRELIKKVWEAAPLLCPKCQKEMRIVSLIDDRDEIARILRHLGIWEQGVRVLPARAPTYAFHRSVLPSRGCFIHGLIAFAASFFQELTPLSRFATFPNMEELLQTGSSGQVPVQPEKRFLINLS